MEKAVFKATRKDAVHPKQKHVDTLIQMTLSGVSMEELFMLIQDRFSEANWVVSFKALILVHILMHESNGPTIYDYLIHHSNALDMTRFRDRHGTKGVSEFEQSKNVRTYASYLNDKVLAFKAIRIDHVTQKNPAGSQIYQKAPSDIKFMLLEVSTIQKQLHSVLKNRFESDTLDNETTFSAFRYCLRDMLKLFQVMNLGVMKMLKVYFEMREDDMRRALDLYKRFVKLTDRTDEYLKVARQFENIFGFSIPNLIHAPLSLSKALEEFLDMPVEERAATVSEMKSARRPEKESPPASATVSTAAAAKTGTAGASAARNKPNYGLRLKPELLALTGDAPPPPPSPTTKVAGKTNNTGAPAVQARSTTTAPLAAAASATTTAAGKKPAAKAETDFIDFFSSIDDEETADNSLGAPNTAVAAVAAFGYSTPMDNSSGLVSEQHAVANNAMTVQGGGGGGGMTDFDAMFHALSNPFAAQQQQQPMQAGVMSSASPFAGMSTSNIGSSSNVSSTALGLQQQQQPFGGFPTAGNNTATTVSSSTMQFASFGNTTGLTSTPFQPQQQQQQQQLGSSSSGFGDVSANNPFRQSMYPAQPDLLMQQAMMTNQMSQLSMQPQQQQSAYNPFAQRQTVYLGSFQQQQPQQQPQSLGSSSPFATMTSSGGGQAPDQFASFNAFGNNNTTNNNNAGIMAGHQQHQHQQQPGGAVNNNNQNFADFNFFQ
ncbi:hypothetical protein GGI19_003844 [Coemansia pectinata]|uniref:ENTH domain-containing protein n=1 Tax=Coemansia pectinata TaxID=1052879 RepID=A0A9W8GXE0_9FUNG|nr:hypothetical protein GGI19_003844 [Coemansia pectinata]